MKIRPLSPETQAKAAGLLRQAFGDSSRELKLFENLHLHGRAMQEWVCLHVNSVIGYICFTKAYHGQTVCGLHLSLLAVKPEFQKQGVGSELMHFALRQAAIKERSIFVLGEARFFSRFGFAPCEQPSCALAHKKRAAFLALRNSSTTPFTVGYEPEFGG